MAERDPQAVTDGPVEITPADIAIADKANDLWTRQQTLHPSAAVIAAALARAGSRLGPAEGDVERAWKQGYCKGDTRSYALPPTRDELDKAWRASKMFKELADRAPCELCAGAASAVEAARIIGGFLDLGQQDELVRRARAWLDENPEIERAALSEGTPG